MTPAGTDRAVVALGRNADSVRHRLVITRVVVGGDDPAFRSPSKFIAPLYTESQASDVADRHGWML
jgi:carbamate kinase